MKALENEHLQALENEHLKAFENEHLKALENEHLKALENEHLKALEKDVNSDVSVDDLRGVPIAPRILRIYFHPRLQ